MEEDVVAVTGELGGHLALDWKAQEVEVTDDVEDLVANELVRETQLRVDDVVFADENEVVQPAARPESKLVDHLATRFEIPIEVLPFALGIVKRKIGDMGITPTVRMAERKMGPVVTDNGNFILDLKFLEPIKDPAKVAVDLKMISGVVETGLFVGMTDEVHVGLESGSRILK